MSVGILLTRIFNEHLQSKPLLLEDILEDDVIHDLLNISDYRALPAATFSLDRSVDSRDNSASVAVDRLITPIKLRLGQGECL